MTFEFGSIFWVLTHGRFVSGLFERRLIDSALWGGFFFKSTYIFGNPRIPIFIFTRWGIYSCCENWQIEEIFYENEFEKEISRMLLHTSERPKFGIDKRHRKKLSVSEPKFLFAETETLFLSNFTNFFLLLGGKQVFISLEINLVLQK